MVYEMIKFKDYINESLDKPYEWDNIKSSKDEYKYMFFADDINKIEIKYIARFLFVSDMVWDFDFNQSGGSTKITGDSGSPFRIFATVLDIFDDFMKKVKPNMFGFSAKEKSRQRLYDRFSKTITKKYKYDITFRMDSGDKEYIFTKR